MRDWQLGFVLASMEDQHLVPGRGEFTNEEGADEARSSENNYPHGPPKISIRYRDMRSRSRTGFAPPADETVAVFARVPAAAAQKLSRAALELRRPKQAVIAELVERYAGVLGDELALGRASVSHEPLQVLTPEQLAELLQVDVALVTSLATKGEIPGRRIGREWRFSRAAVLEWLASPADQDL